MGGDEATLAKSLIISLEDAVANWYSRLPPGCIYSWPQLKEKYLLNFQGFQAKLDSEEDFLLCTQREKETPQFLPKVFTVEGSSPRGIRRSSHRPSYQSPTCGASAQSHSQRAA
jgi:hypothetical protein